MKSEVKHQPSQFVTVKLKIFNTYFLVIKIARKVFHRPSVRLTTLNYQLLIAFIKPNVDVSKIIR